MLDEYIADYAGSQGKGVAGVFDPALNCVESVTLRRQQQRRSVSFGKSHFKSFEELGCVARRRMERRQ
jgi:hypothetical protein